VQNSTRRGRSAAALALTVCQIGRNSVRPVPQEPPILVVTQTLLRPLRPPPPAVVRPLLPPQGSGSSPFIGEENPPGSPDGHTRHARLPATPAGHGARRTAATSGRRAQAQTGARSEREKCWRARAEGGGALNESSSGGPNARARPPEAATRAPRAPRSSPPTMRGATAAEGAPA